MSNGFTPPDIVGPYQQERAARTSLDWARIAAEAADKADRAPATGSGKRRRTPLDRYAASLQKMLQGSYRQPYDELTNRLATMGQQAETGVNTAMDQLRATLQGQANPYEGFQAQQTQVSPELSGLLQSQGVSQSPLQQYAATINQSNAGQATAFQNLGDTLKQLYTTQQQGRLADVDQNRANLMTTLGANRMGMGTQVEQQALGQRNELLKLLLSALGQGGNPGPGRLM